MGTQVTLAYSITPLGLSAAEMAALLSAVPLPRDVIEGLALRIISDATVAGPPAVRTIVLGFSPTVNADATLTLDSAGEILAVPVGVNGVDYIQPPLVTVTYPAGEGPPPGNRPLLKSAMEVAAVAMSSNGGGYVTPAVSFLGGLPPPSGALSDSPFGGCVRYVNVKERGLGYDPATTTVEFVGGGAAGAAPTRAATGRCIFDSFGRIISIFMTDMGEGYVQPPQVRILPGAANPTKTFKGFAIMAEGRPARGTAVVAVGAITGITVDDPGGNYQSLPTILIEEAGGAGAVAVPRMGVGNITVIARSKGVPAAATVTITPVFPSNFPLPNAVQATAFGRLFEALFRQETRSPVVSAAPVVA